MSIQKMNIDLADQLHTLADLSDISGKSFWSVRAYRNASSLIRGLDIPITDINDITELSGIGDGISAKIREFLKFGSIKELQALETKFPKEALSMTVVPGIGAKKAYKYYQAGIKNFQELIQAANDGKITNENIMRGIKLAQATKGRYPRNDIIPVVSPLFSKLKSSLEVQRISFAGSMRRGKDTVKDIDILVISSDREKTIRTFQEFGSEIINGADKSRIMLPVDFQSAIQIDLLFTTPQEWGAALAYFTGSLEHNVKLRKLANERGMKFNEHEFTSSTGQWLGGTQEEDIYNLLGLPFHPPELREGDTLLSKIPNLITRGDITDDWHTHSVWSSDAVNTIDEMVATAKANGLKTLGISDHTEKNYGWDPNKIPLRRLEAEQAAAKYGMQVFAGCETGINIDGTLDWPEEYLSKMDYVIASIHRSHQNNVTERLVTALKHPKVKFIGHPTGMMLGRREIPDADWDLIFKTCADHNKIMEINGARMDLPVPLIKKAKLAGCKFIINSDAHSINQFNWQDSGIITARRAGLEKADLATPEV